MAVKSVTKLANVFKTVEEVSLNCLQVLKDIDKLK